MYSYFKKNPKPNILTPPFLETFRAIEQRIVKIIPHQSRIMSSFLISQILFARSKQRLFFKSHYSRDLTTFLGI